MSEYRIRDKRTRKFVEKFLSQEQIKKELSTQCGGIRMYPITLVLAEGITLKLEQGEVAKVLPDGIYPFPAFHPSEDGDYLVWTEDGWDLDYWEQEGWISEFDSDKSRILYFRELPGNPTKNG